MSIGRWLSAHRRDFHSSLCSAWVLQFADSAFRSESAAFTLVFVRRGFYNAVSGAVDIGNFAFTLAFVRRGFYNPVRAGRSTTCSTAFTLAFVRRGFYNQRALPPLVIKESFHSSLC